MPDQCWAWTAALHHAMWPSPYGTSLASVSVRDKLASLIHPATFSARCAKGMSSSDESSPSMPPSVNATSCTPSAHAPGTSWSIKILPMQATLQMQAGSCQVSVRCANKHVSVNLLARQPAPLSGLLSQCSAHSFCTNKPGRHSCQAGAIM